jgi:NAD(P)-dependent dehydrogenase (short-subunit alcohol dehydrogenase family)
MGAKLAITARKADELAEARAHLEAQGVEVLTVVNDLSKFDQIPGLVDTVVKHYGKIDILVNNAGATWGAPAEDYPPEAWMKVINLNVNGMFFLTQAVGKRCFIPQKSGRVIVTASIAGLRGNPPDMRPSPTTPARAPTSISCAPWRRNGASTTSTSMPSARVSSPRRWPAASWKSSATRSSTAPRCAASAARKTSKG